MRDLNTIYSKLATSANLGRHKTIDLELAADAPDAADAAAKIEAQS